MLKMGFVGLLEFSLQCCDLLAWPLLDLVYPLLPVWPYVRLVIVFWFVIPHFDGAFYVYKHLICPCLSLDLQIVINWFNKWKKSSSKRENFLAEVERYVKENGPEGLEKVVGSQVSRSNLLERTESNPNVKELKAISSMENKESKSKEPNVAQKNIKAVQVSQTEPNLTGTENSRSPIRDIKEKAMGAAEEGEILQTPSSKEVHEWTCGISQVTSQRDTTFNSHLDSKEYKSVYEALEIKNQAELKLTQIGNSTFAASETKEKAVEVATGREVPESWRKDQKEWTCVLCQLTTPSEAILNFHLPGTKHKAACEALKAKNEAFAPKVAPASSGKVSHQPKMEPRKSRRSRRSKHFDKSQEQPAEGASSNGMKRNIVMDLKKKVDGQEQNPTKVPKEGSTTKRCNLCNVKCPSKIHQLASHLKGRKHQEKMQQRQQSKWKEHRINLERRRQSRN